MADKDSNFGHITPVLPTADVNRDIIWYNEKLGFDLIFEQNGYAVLHREHLFIHLQWHANTVDDPLLGGSVIRILVKNIKPIFEEFNAKGIIATDELIMNTPWNTHEFGVFDLNKNAIFIVQDLKNG